MNEPRRWIIGLGLVGAVVLAIIIFNGSPFSEASNGLLAGQEVTLYKSPSCHCCKEYSTYLEERGDAAVTNVDRMNLTPIKNKFGIPRDLESCHTSIVGDYVVEGHVPLEAVQELLREQPDIKGIALPGMPHGSPGMNGLKTERFQIFAIQNDGSYEPYITL